MTKTRKKFKTEKNYAKVQNFIRMGCSTSEIAKFMNLTYNQAWYLRKDVTNRNQREALENTKQIMTAKPIVKTRVNTKPRVEKVMSVEPQNVKVTNNGNALTITISIAI